MTDTRKAETCLTCGKAFAAGPNTTAREVAQAHESITGHTISGSVPAIVAECWTCNVKLLAADCQAHHEAGHNWRVITQFVCHTCNSKSFRVGSWMDGQHRAAGHDVREVRK